jgi:hypothetical protein
MHGLYYHVSFYDLQAANHITMLGVPPALIRRELTEALTLDADDYWIINCSNVKPHVYYLAYIAALWQAGDADVTAWQTEYCAQYYGTDAVSPCFDSYFRHAARYGPHEDDIAGDQYYNYTARMLASAFMRGEAVSDALRWASDADTLRGQAEHILAVCEKARYGYVSHAALCERAARTLRGGALQLLEASLQLQAEILLYCAEGAGIACMSLLAAMGGNDKRAFYLAGKSRDLYRRVNTYMRGCERGKWQEFYANDCLTDVGRSAWVMETVSCSTRRGRRACC